MEFKGRYINENEPINDKRSEHEFIFSRLWRRK